MLALFDFRERLEKLENTEISNKGNDIRNKEVAEADGIFKSLFQDNPRTEGINAQEPVLAEKEKAYYDDKGSLYRMEDELVPNNDYEVNGYRYITDEFGRIISAEGELRIKDREGRLPIEDSIAVIGKGDELEDDDRGHLIGDRFDGSNGLENMIPQEAEINRGNYKNFENELAEYVKAGKEVSLAIEPVYEGDSRRPTALLAVYSIDGSENMRIFPNGKEQA